MHVYTRLNPLKLHNVRIEDIEELVLGGTEKLQTVSSIQKVSRYGSI